MRESRVEVPDGLAAYLHSCFGGILKVSGGHPRIGHRKDSSFKMTEVHPQEDANIRQAVSDYYLGAGYVLIPHAILDVEVILVPEFHLWVSLTNYTHSTRRLVGNIDFFDTGQELVRRFSGRVRA